MTKERPFCNVEEIALWVDESCDACSIVIEPIVFKLMYSDDLTVMLRKNIVLCRCIEMCTGKT